MPRHRGPKKPAGPKKPPLTHFLCLPLVNASSRPQLEASMQHFMDAVVPQDHTSPPQAEQADEVPLLVASIHPKAIRPIGALHLTLNVMSLDKPRLQEAVETLQSLDLRSLIGEPQVKRSGASGPTQQSSAGASTLDRKPASLERPISPPLSSRTCEPLVVDLKGLVSMHHPSKTSILYTAPSDPTNRLYDFCLAVLKIFANKGLLVDTDRELKLHATIVNTIYAKGRKKQPPKWNQRRETPESAQAGSSFRTDEPVVGLDKSQGSDDRSQGHGPDANAPLKIDATALLEQYEDLVWAEGFVLDRLAICEMGAKKFMDVEGKVVNEEYTEVAYVKLPGAST